MGRIREFFSIILPDFDRFTAASIVKTRLIARQTRKQGEQLVVVNMNGV